MKYILILKILILYIFVILQVAECFRSKSKSNTHFRNKMKHKNSKNLTKIKLTKKDGPLSWDSLVEDQVLEGLLKNEISTSDNHINSNQNSVNFQSQPVFLGSNSNLTTNHKSKTFRFLRWDRF